MILPIYILLIIISLILLKYIADENFQIPNSIYTVIIIGTIISFITFGFIFINIHILDIKHPVYYSESISTLSWLISISGGLIISIPFSIYWIIKWNKLKK